MLTRVHESEVRRHFTLGEAAAGAAAATAAIATAAPTDREVDRLVDRDFYDHEVYNDRKFFPVKSQRDEVIVRLPPNE